MGHSPFGGPDEIGGTLNEPGTIELNSRFPGEVLSSRTVGVEGFRASKEVFPFADLLFVFNPFILSKISGNKNPAYAGFRMTGVLTARLRGYRIIVCPKSKEDT